MLAVEGLTSHYATGQVLFGIDLKVAAGEVVALLGRNGMGKTTTLHAIMGIVAPSGGRIRFRGRDIGGLASYRIAKLGLGLVPEGRQVFPNLTVLENLIATASNHQGHREPWTVERIFALFPELAERRKVMGNLLSGGEQQMLAIGRTLMTNPSLLMLDEATEGLAPLIREKIWQALKTIRQNGLAILLVDKNLKDLLALADRHYIVEKGCIVWSGTSEALAAQEEVQHRYLGV